MLFNILGPLDVVDHESAVPLGGMKQRALLGVLLLHANEVVSVDTLVEALWGSERPNRAVKGLQVQVSQLRKLLGADRVLTRAPGYLMVVPPDHLDSARFDRFMEEAEQLSARDPAAAADKLDSALALWRGSALADLAFEPFAQADIKRLEEARLTALERRVDARMAMGVTTEVVSELGVLVEEHPFRERLRAQLILALYRAGRQAEALDAYRETQEMLLTIGIEPSVELKELQRAVLNQDPTLARPPRQAPFRRPPSEAQEGAERFVGRDRELAVFERALEGAFAGRGSLLLMSGEPGIGKSRLTDEMTARCRDRGARVLIGRCWEAGGAPAYWPWVQSLRPYVHETSRDVLRSQLGAGAGALAHLVPELREMFDDLPAAPDLESDGARFRLFDSMAAFLRDAAARRPLVLVLDDLHAADEPSLLLLRFIARELDDSRLLILGAYRDVDPTPSVPLSGALSELAREPTTRTLNLKGLDEAEVACLVESTAGSPRGSDMASALHAETEGNPLFVGEILRLLAAEGQTGGSGPGGFPIPQNVKEVIGRRLRHVSPECLRALTRASVLGREFDLETLAHLSALEYDNLFELLESAVEARLVAEVPGSPGRMRFAHALIRDTAYQSLMPARRVQLHRRVGATLEALHSDDLDPYLAELAHHYLEGAPGGDAPKAMAYASRAADRAVELLAYEEAARLYAMALSALELTLPRDDLARCDLLLALATAHARAGDLTTAKDGFAQAAEVARRLEAPMQLARAALGYGGPFVWFRAGNDRRLTPLLEDALGALPEDHPLRARVLARLAGALRDRPVPERRAALSREGVAIARSLRDPAGLAYALEGTYAALSLPRDSDEWLAMAKELCSLADDARDNERAFAGHLHAWGAYVIRADMRAAETEFETLSALAAELRQPTQLSTLMVVQAMRATFSGRLEEAEHCIERFRLGAGGRGAFAPLDDTTLHYVMHLQSWAVRRERGGLADVLEPVERFVVEYPTYFIFRCVLANIYSQLGHEEAARKELDRLAANDFAALDVGTEWFFGASLLAEVCSRLGDASRAEHLYEALLPYGDCNVLAHPEFSLGSASRYLGILAATCVRWDEAVQHLDRAVAMNARMGARPWLAHTQEDYARVLTARDWSGDPAAALVLATDALAAYRELDMPTWAEQASELQRALVGGA
jgi:DNA-binding SARP family transcriptional activator